LILKEEVIKEEICMTAFHFFDHFTLQIYRLFTELWKKFHPSTQSKREISPKHLEYFSSQLNFNAWFRKLHYYI